MNLSDVSDTSNLKLILELLQKRCKNLTKITYNKGGMRILDLERFGPMARKLPATPEFSKFFRTYIEVLNNITHLDLGHTKLNNPDISLIGANGQNLKLLNIHNAEEVTDAGFYCLFAAVNLKMKPDSSYGQCKLLEYLDISETNISADAISVFIIQYQAQLKGINVSRQHEIMIELIVRRGYCCNSEVEDYCPDPEYYPDAVIVDMALSMASMAPKLKIDELVLQSYSDSGVDETGEFVPLSQKLEIALIMAAEVKKVTILLDLERNDSIENLKLVASFKNITDLKIDIDMSDDNDMYDEDVDEYMSNFFQIEMVPLLLAIGHKLKNLSLGSMKKVDGGKIINCCPNLEKLDLDNNICSPDSALLNIEPNYPLKYFRVCNYDCGPPRSFMKAIGHFKMLEELHIIGHMEAPQSFDDEVMQEICELNPFCHLVHLYLYEVDEITIQSFEESILMNPFVPLKKVTLHRCKKITRSDAQRVKKFMKVMKYDCEILFL